MLESIKKLKQSREQGFTLIELLVVIIIIGVLAAIALPIFANQQRSAQAAVAKSDIRQISQAAALAKMKTGKSLMAITGSNYTANTCVALPAETDLATQPQTGPCWTAYKSALKKISDASGMDITNLIDPLGRPYLIDENEGETTSCTKDAIGFFKDPFNTATGGVGAKSSYYVVLDNVTVACS